MNQDPARYQEFRWPPSEWTIPHWQFVAPERIGNAAVWLLQHNLALERANLAKETDRLLGVARMGKNFVIVVDGSIDWLVSRGLCDTEGTWSIWKVAA